MLTVLIDPILIAYIVATSHIQLKNIVVYSKNVKNSKDLF